MLQAVTAYITSTDRPGLILAVSRKDDPSAFGLPGGKIDPGETPAQAIVREVREETGLVFSEVHEVFREVCPGGRDGVAYDTYTFVGQVSGEIDTSESGVVAWVSEDTLLKGPFGRYNQALFHRLQTLRM
jgi:mutator protein MutT